MNSAGRFWQSIGIEIKNLDSSIFLLYFILSWLKYGTLPWPVYKTNDGSKIKIVF